MSDHTLTESSKAVQLLWKKLQNGEVPHSHKAKTVWELKPLFLKHKLDYFWTKFNRLKTEHEHYNGKYMPNNLIVYLNF